jgi:DNA-binding Lrp family transcriptional regulator
VLTGHGAKRVERSKRTRGRIAVFKGREAKLNHAIFQILALNGPQTIYAIHKEIKTQRTLSHVRYTSVNKRVRVLEESGYIKKIAVKIDQSRLQSLHIRTNRQSLPSIIIKLNRSRESSHPSK